MTVVLYFSYLFCGYERLQVLIFTYTSILVLLFSSFLHANSLLTGITSQFLCIPLKLENTNQPFVIAIMVLGYSNIGLKISDYQIVHCIPVIDLSLVSWVHLGGGRWLMALSQPLSTVLLQ